MSAKKVLLLGNYKQTVAVIRSLARAGYSVVLGRSHYRVSGQFSRYVTEVWQHPDIEDEPQVFIDALLSFLLQRRDIQYVYPLGETEMMSLLPQVPMLASSVGVVMPDAATVTACLDKSGSYALAARLGIPVMRTENTTQFAELQAALEDIGYPCVIKPQNSFMPFFGHKALILNSAAEFTAAFPYWPAAETKLVVQEFVRGFRHNCNVVALRGELLAYFETRTLRTDRADNTGYSSHSLSCKPMPLLKDYCQRLLRELNYSGTALIQFLVSEKDNRIVFLENNPRLGANCGFAHACGYNLPRMALDCVRYQRGEGPAPTPCNAVYPADKNSVWLLGDLKDIQRNFTSGHLRFAEAVRRVWLVWRTFLRADAHAIWSWRDPLPACFELTRIVWEGSKAMAAYLPFRQTVAK